MSEAERELLLMVADYLDKPVTQQRFTIRDLAAKVRQEAEKPKVCTMPMPKDTDLLRSMGTDGIKWGIGMHDAIQAMYLIDIDADWLGSWFANAIEAGRSAGGGHGSGAAEEPAQSCETCRYEAWPGYHHPCYGCVDGAKKPYQNWQPRTFQPPQDGEVKVGKPYVFVPPDASPFRRCDECLTPEQECVTCPVSPEHITDRKPRTVCPSCGEGVRMGHVMHHYDCAENVVKQCLKDIKRAEQQHLDAAAREWLINFRSGYMCKSEEGIVAHLLKKVGG